MKNLLILIALVLIVFSVTSTEAIVSANRPKSLKERAVAYCSCRGGIKRWVYQEGVDKFILVCKNGDYVLGHFNVKKVVFKGCKYKQE